MKFAICSLFIGVISTTLSAEKSSPTIPPVPRELLRVSQFSANARSVAGGQNKFAADDAPTGSTRTTKAQSSALEISVKNLGKQANSVTLRWFWLGRYESSGNWFRTGDGEKAITVDPTKVATIVTDAVEVESHKTSGASSYKSGGKLLGWIVIGENVKGEREFVRASDSLYLGFAAQPPPKLRQRSKASESDEM